MRHWLFHALFFYIFSAYEYFYVRITFMSSVINFSFLYVFLNMQILKHVIDIFTFTYQLTKKKL